MKADLNQSVGTRTLYLLLIIASATFIAGCSSVFTPFGTGGPPESTLANTYWQLTRVAHHSISVNKPQRQPYMLLTSQKHQFQGFAGCNNIHGRYKRSNKQLRFTVIASTRMLCRGHMQIEHALIRALDKTRHMRIQDHTLFLMGANGQVLARFDARLKQFKSD